MVECRLNVLGACKDCSGQVMRRDEGLHYATNKVSVSTIHEAAERFTTIPAENKKFVEAVMPGHASFKVENGDVYSGEVDATGAMHGLGTLQRADSDYYYTGQWIQMSSMVMVLSSTIMEFIMVILFTVRNTAMRW